MLTGERSLLRAAGAVLGLGPRYVILKKGEHGAFLLSKDVHFSIPAYPVENVVGMHRSADFAEGVEGSSKFDGNEFVPMLLLGGGLGESQASDAAIQSIA